MKIIKVTIDGLFYRFFYDNKRKMMSWDCYDREGLLLPGMSWDWHDLKSEDWENFIADIYLLSKNLK
jgi:uncharacterized protein YjhX (UPF0386 family)